mmetsp:Transcript_76789/g.126686  ORF Transcript_76789/g.126686 Transcript_76789/m.126686 type:complete len:287 (-) Transcript_76789:1370-2230(-)
MGNARAIQEFEGVQEQLRHRELKHVASGAAAPQFHHPAPQELPGVSFSRGRAVHRRFAARPGKEERQQQRQVPTTGDTWNELLQQQRQQQSHLQPTAPLLSHRPVVQLQGAEPFMSKNSEAKGRQHQGWETLERQIQKGHRKAIAPGTTQQKAQRGHHGHCPHPLQILQTLQSHGDQRIQEPAQKEARQWPQRRIPTIRRALELSLRAAEGMPWHLPGMQPGIAQDVGAAHGHRGCGHGQQVPPQPAAVDTDEAMVEVPLPRTHFTAGGQEATHGQQLPDGALLPL